MSDSNPIPAARTPRIMILEDEGQLIDLYEMLIREWFRSPVIHSFTNGNAAWDELSRLEPELLIMDCAHPGMSGVEILEKLAARPAGCPVLLTSDLFTESMVKFRDSRLKIFYLPKPFGVAQFCRALNEIIGPSDFPERQAMIGGAEPAPS